MGEARGRSRSNAPVNRQGNSFGRLISPTQAEAAPSIKEGVEAAEAGRTTLNSKQGDSRSAASVDELVERITKGIYQVSSRRGLLSKVGKLAMIATGIQVLQFLPVDRTTPEVAADAHFCNAWYNCGLQASRQCECCFYPSQLCACPGGTNPGYYWLACCCTQPGCTYGNLIAYWDCCYSSGTPSCLNPSCSCHRGPSQPVWCGGAGSYYCTTTCIQPYGCG